MQDRFKFRIWHETLKQMHYNDFIVTATGYTAKLYQENDYMMKFNQEDLEFDKQCVVMQCTGLKDKNGKLIYEGDVVSDKSNHIRVVVWEQDCFKYPALKISRYFHRPISNQLEERKIGLRGKLTFQDAIGKCDKKQFEVIGNIYENKELLNEI